MNVQASESMNEAWVALQGLVVNGAFPLHRYLSGSEHTGVFLAESRRHKLPQVAIKLVRSTPARADAQLSRWLTADGLAHPHLIRIFEAGRCQLGGLQYLYAVMEYADQNLAELLDHRALTEDEAREMLGPTLSALAFLHERKSVQGQLKPSNILVVGDQLKLASDTIRRVGESTESDRVMTVYDPPEARDGSYWPAGDVWALGVTLCEALTRNRPVGLHDGNRPVAFPREFPTAFREIVGRCLSRRPHDRPSLVEIDAWLHGNQPIVGVPAAPAPVAAKAAKREAVDVAPKAVVPDASVAAAKTVASEVSAPAPKAVAREASAPAAKTVAREAPAPAAKTVARAPTEVPPKAASRDVSEQASKAAAREVPSAPSRTGTIEVSRAPLPAARAAAQSRTATPPGAATPAAAATSATAAASAAAATSPAAPASPAAARSRAAAKSSQPPVMTATASQRTSKSPSQRRTVVVTLAAAIALALIWSGARMLRTQQTSAMAPVADVIDDTGVQVSAPPQVASQAVPALASERAVSTDSLPAEAEPEATVPGARAVLPEVPQRARQGIRGHVKVSVRVIVDQDGTVFAALVDDGGPSKYFSRLAIDAAKKWTFAPVEAEGQRFVQVLFDFTREGTTAHAIPLR